MKQYRAVLGLLSRRERWQMMSIFIFMLPNALFQVAGVASVMPFIAVLAQPELVETNALLFRLYEYLGSPPQGRFLGMLAGAALVLLVLSNALAAFTAWLILRFSYMRAHSLSLRLMAIYLARDYAFFLVRNPSDLTKNVLTEVKLVVSGFIMPLLQIVANFIVVITIVVMLMFVDLVLALSVGLVLGGAYGIIYFIFRGRLRVLGRHRLEANGRRFKAAHETFGAIKDLKVTGRESYYFRRYQRASYDFSVTQSSAQIIAQLPRYALEVIAFGVVLMVALYLATSEHSMQNALPMIALYAMAGHRLMPALQKVFDCAATLRVSSPVVDRIAQEMEIGQEERGIVRSDVDMADSLSPLRLQKEIVLRGITYRYSDVSASVLNGVDMTVAAHTTVAFVGESGAGKSTLVDIILGLLKPEQGTISVDGHVLDDEKMPGWRRLIGYVPQAIYLADDTLRRNIALGIPDREIDDAAVIAAAKAAAIHDFIMRELPDGYDTVTGDRGVRLSGGQRQRVGIARALYNNPELLILDEATSALDGSTEAAVMDAIDRLAGQKTIIMIAHRLATVKNCDCVYLLAGGRLIGSGTYDELFSTQPEFRRMASVHDDAASVDGPQILAN